MFAHDLFRVFRSLCPHGLKGLFVLHVAQFQVPELEVFRELIESFHVAHAGGDLVGRLQGSSIIGGPFRLEGFHLLLEAFQSVGNVLELGPDLNVGGNCPFLDLEPPFGDREELLRLGADRLVDAAFLPERSSVRASSACFTWSRLASASPL